ncbi:heme ABC transporter permease/ATP-binding protein CydD [Photobacterium iliopiscarium]|jgi:ATP-binding cassette subfamily C protein CydD|uniref:Thiol reductant ABC exporter subunit CydD n=1 Tax=Photobacterium iliopiscarium TaxID=56192 RepID=A0A2T3MP97_9GAMM|nr:cysteine/glutathione ABC transporter permease/ATP-binding protein CydD [Photobacterium iliopiscarium]KJG13019.1 cysteine ABC transporter ATP-binding protein [Photobacterium iliopiscarium]MCD9467932.1 thiol reductant ABC exporter subunit CydD [Photobacterium iliopiscarium]MCD9488218.1 cysteine/glutathione ABC transporter permease/ATP-binding protein CydD [Photobacterium iliopiscarium]MCF2244936.1 cysteine/glutathione ABC transporter permease/ATP-binding protein CydD [Photobacterium iliopiscar
MDKQLQRDLTKWLKSQSKLAKHWMMFSIGLGFISGLLLIGQAALLANILHQLIMEHTDKYQLVNQFVGLIVIIGLRALCSWGREVCGYRCGEQIRLHIRQLILNRLQNLGPAYIKGKPAGVWASLVLEQVEEMQDFFARYLPQMSLAVLIPVVILVVVFPLNWAAGLIFLITAPLVPFFMALVGLGAADANRRNFKALQRLSGHFYDRLQGLSTLRLFNRVDAEAENLDAASHVLRKRTMEVLRLAFLSSAVLEFFSAISVAIVAVYFGFAFIGELNFGNYGVPLSLFTGLFVLVLAPEFYQPLRDLGTFYHAKAQAIGAAESIVEFLNIEADEMSNGDTPLPTPDAIHITVTDLEVLSPEGKILAGPLSFTINTNEHVALIGPSGAGKTSLLNALLGFLPYRGSIKINDVELNELKHDQWRQAISWVGQNPLLVHGTVRDNITLGNPSATNNDIEQVTRQAYADEFIQRLEKGYEHHVGDRSGGLSVGQAQRIAVARAMLQNGAFWLLDEPTASLDANSERLVLESLALAVTNRTTLMVSHRLDQLHAMDRILVMDNGKLVQNGAFDAIRHQGLFADMLTSTDKRDLDA